MVQAKVTTGYVGRWKFSDSKNARGSGGLVDGRFDGNTDMDQLRTDHVSALDGCKASMIYSNEATTIKTSK